MEFGVRRLTSNNREIRFTGRRVKVAAIAVVAGGLSLLSFASPVMAAAPSTLAVAVVGPGAVTSAPAGINCPAKCSASFAPGTRVVLTAKAKSGAQFQRWGGSCTGAAGCNVRVSGLAVVGAQFAGPSARPTRYTLSRRTRDVRRRQLPGLQELVPDHSRRWQYQERLGGHHRG